MDNSTATSCLRERPAYDQLIEKVERSPQMRASRLEGIGTLYNVLQQTAVFDFSKIGQVPGSNSLEENGFLYDNFFLPFPIVALSDSHGQVMIIADKSDHQKGLASERAFLIFVPSPTILFLGNMRVELDEVGEMRLKLLCQACSNVAHLELNHHGNSAFLLDAASYLVLAVAYLNTPANFVIRDEALNKVRLEEQAFRRGQIARSHERPMYTILHPSKIRERFGFQRGAEETGGKKCPHARRRHFRTLRSDFYAEKQGQQIIIPATWIGPHERIVGGRRYTVMLDH